MTKFIRFTNTITTPGVMLPRVSASQAPTRNTPNCAIAPATAPMVPMTAAICRRRHLAPSTAWLLAENSFRMACSALKLFTTEKPLRLSFSVATKPSLRSDTCFSAASSRPPARRLAMTGRMDRATAARVRRGLYRIIIAKAPANIKAFCTRENAFSR